MSELSGFDAFDSVMDRLLNAERKNAVLEEARSLADQRAQEATRARDVAVQRKAADEEKQKKALPALAELWKAADAVLTLVAAGEELGTHSDCIARLRKAIAEAADHCDQLPF